MSYADLEFAAAQPARVFDPDEAHDEIRNNAGQLLDDWRDVVDSQPHDSPLVPSDEQSTHRAPQRREIAFEGILRVNGYVSGALHSRTGHVIVDADGTVDADIFAPNVTIHGCVRGDIRATQRVELAGSARVIGDVETLNLLIEPGARFEGRCVFLPRSEAAGTLAALDFSDPQPPTS